MADLEGGQRRDGGGESAGGPGMGGAEGGEEEKKEGGLALRGSAEKASQKVGLAKGRARTDKLKVGRRMGGQKAIFEPGEGRAFARYPCNQSGVAERASLVRVGFSAPACLSPPLSQCTCIIIMHVRITPCPANAA